MFVRWRPGEAVLSWTVTGVEKKGERVKLKNLSAPKGSGTGMGWRASAPFNVASKLIA